MWASLLLKFWKPALGILIGLWAVWYLHHRGYESGYAVSEAQWRVRFAAAERELAAANARTEKTEALSTQAAAESQRRIDDAQKTLLARSADYDSRLRSLSMRLAAARSSSQPLPSIPAGPTGPDAATESEQRASAFGGSLASIGADCESDSLKLAELQRWVTEQRAIFEAAATPADH